MARRAPRILAGLLALAVLAASPVVPVAAAPTARASVSVLAPQWVSSGGQVPIGVRLTLKGPATSVTTRISLLDSAGRVQWRRSQVRSRLTAATYDVAYTVSTAALGLAPGVYTLQSSVSVRGAAAIVRTRRLFVTYPSAPRVPVSVIIRVTGTPEVGPDGSPIGDAATAQTIADASELARLSLVEPQLHLTAAIPPYLLDEWAAASRVDGAGAPASDGGSSETTGAADALSALRNAVAAGMPLLRAGYGEPDLSGLATDTTEVARQLSTGDAARASALGTGSAASVGATGFGTISGLIPRDAVAALSSAGASFLVVDPASVQPSKSATIALAPYRLVPAPTAGSSSGTTTVLVLDRADARLLTDPLSADTLAANLFTRAETKKGRLPVVLEIAVGSDGVSMAQLEPALDALSRLPWVELVDAPTAAVSGVTGTAALRRKPVDPTPAPATYSAAVAWTRPRVYALRAALGAAATAKVAIRNVMLAESRSWAGPDGSWGLADRGVAYATAADATVSSILGKVTVSAPAVTLPGSEGRVPISVINGSDRAIRIVVTARSSRMRVQSQRIATTISPGENILSVPVSLGTVSSGALNLSVSAGGLQIASTTTTVSASYLDRVALLGMVVLILIVLLLIVRRRISRASSERDRNAASRG
jgi:hypothetical protein